MKLFQKVLFYNLYTLLLKAASDFTLILIREVIHIALCLCVCPFLNLLQLLGPIHDPAAQSIVVCRRLHQPGHFFQSSPFWPLLGLKQEDKAAAAPYSPFPTKHFTNWKLNNPSIDASQLHKIRCFTDFEVLKLGNVWSGSSFFLSVSLLLFLFPLFFNPLTQQSGSSSSLESSLSS